MFWEWLLAWKIQAQHHLAATSYSEDKGPPIHEPDRNFYHFEYYDPFDLQLDRICLVLSAYQSVFGFSNICRSSTGFSQLNMVPAILFTCDFHQAELLEMHHDTILILGGDTTL